MHDSGVCMHFTSPQSKSLGADSEPSSSETPPVHTRVGQLNDAGTSAGINEAASVFTVVADAEEPKSLPTTDGAPPAPGAEPECSAARSMVLPLALPSSMEPIPGSCGNPPAAAPKVNDGNSGVVLGPVKRTKVASATVALPGPAARGTPRPLNSLKK